MSRVMQNAHRLFAQIPADNDLLVIHGGRKSPKYSVDRWGSSDKVIHTEMTLNSDIITYRRQSGKLLSKSTNI